MAQPFAEPCSRGLIDAEPGPRALGREIEPGRRRVVLAAIEANEPVLALKITGAGQRATLSALVKPGMKAVTIRVNDVEGVGYGRGRG